MLPDVVRMLTGPTVPPLPYSCYYVAFSCQIRHPYRKFSKVCPKVRFLFASINAQSSHSLTTDDLI